MTLKTEYKGKVYVSKPFDFEAACLINDEHNSDKNQGILRMCIKAVDYMFENSDINIEKLPPENRTALSTQLWKMYIESFGATKNAQKGEEADV